MRSTTDPGAEPAGTVLTGTIVLGEHGAIALDTTPELARITKAWLESFRDSPDTRDAYERDLKHFVGWSGQHGNIDPLTYRRADIDAYLTYLTAVPNIRTGKPLATTSVARRLSAISSWYGYLEDHELVTGNPCRRVRRPKVDRDHTTTVGLTAAEATAVLHAAASDHYLPSACAVALARFLVTIGARVSEVCALDVADLGHDSGHRTVRLRMKGGKTRTRAIPAELAVPLDAWLDGRDSGPLFLTAAGARINRHEVGSFVRRAARAAGVAGWARITPHSFRHAWATIAREAGASLEERQYALGHADPRTTQRYDRAKEALAADPSYRVAAATAG